MLDSRDLEEELLSEVSELMSPADSGFCRRCLTAGG
jgi:hypothetical protein